MSRRAEPGAVCRALGLLLLTAALLLFLGNCREARRAARTAQGLNEQLLRQIPAVSQAAEGPRTAAVQPDVQAAEPTLTVDGYDCIASLSIPALQLQLPVLAQLDEAGLKLAPCRYAGSLQAGGLVIAAHNYTRHFGRLYCLRPGDAVQLTAADGSVYDYTVQSVQTLSPQAVQQMTDSAYDLTLFTCTYSAAQRVTVRCSRADPAGDAPGI